VRRADAKVTVNLRDLSRVKVLDSVLVIATDLLASQSSYFVSSLVWTVEARDLFLLLLLEFFLFGLLGFHQHLSALCPGLEHWEHVYIGLEDEKTSAL
jgi:hypothetical protein